MTPPVLLLVNAHAHGHFLVYCNNLTLWALSRGWKVAYAGLDAGDSFYRRKFAGNPRVRQVDLGEYAPSVPDGPEGSVPTERRVVLGSEECLRGLNRLVRPTATVLTYCDELFFDLEGPEPATLSFDSPTYGILTFGHREYHLGAWEPYTLRLDETLSGGGNPFSGLFTLDEYHAAFRDPGGERLRFMPDMYREFDPLPASALTGGDARGMEDLRAFLARAPGDLTPIMGKFDRRKNPLWILRAAAEDESLSCVVLGQRVPDPEQDPEIDALMAHLRGKGRLWSRFGFVPEAFFTEVVRCPRLRCMPLPYSSHFGSSGVQLMAHEHGLPVLAPGQGLMAMRIEDHGLGMTYPPGDEAAFRAAFRELNTRGREPYADNLDRFMAHFSRYNLFACFDQAFWGLASGPEGVVNSGGLTDYTPPRSLAEGVSGAGILPPAGEQQAVPTLVSRAAEMKSASALRRAMDLALIGRLEEAAGLLDASDSRQNLLLCALHLRLRQTAEARTCVEHCLRAGMQPEVYFFLQLQIDLVRLLRNRGDNGHLAAAENLARVLLDQQATSAPTDDQGGFDWSPGDRKLGAMLDAVQWHDLGLYLVANRAWATGARCFRASLHADPHEHDVRLNLSDVLRYAKRYEESWAVLDQLEEQNPNWPGLRHKRGQILFEQERFDEARALFEREPEDSPHHEAALDWLAKIPDRPGGPG